MAIGVNADADRLQSTNPPDVSGAFTAVGFVYLVTDRNAYSTVLAFEAGSSYRLLETDTDGTSLTVFDHSLGSLFTSPPSLTEGSWHAVALRYDGSRDGTLDVEPIGGSRTTVASNNPATTFVCTSMSFGANIGFSGEYGDLHLAGWRIWDARLSNAEVDAEFASIAAVRTSNLRSEWPMADSSDLGDDSGNGYDLTAPGSESLTSESDPPLGISGTAAPSTPIATSAASGSDVATGTGAPSTDIPTAAASSGAGDYSPIAPVPSAVAAGYTVNTGTAAATALRPSVVAVGNPVVTTNAVRLLPQGDSITDGPNGSYRDVLYRELELLGYTNLDFVGHRVDQYPADGQPDTDHSGTPGYTIGGLSGDWPTHYAAYAPNATIVMIGTNDIAWWTGIPGDTATWAADGQPSACHAQELDRFIQELVDTDASLLVFVCTIAPMSSEVVSPIGQDRNDIVTEYNQGIRTKVVAARQAAGERVYLLDVNAQLSLGDLYDGIHPTKAALDGVAEYMAPVVAAALVNIASIDITGTAASSTPLPAVVATGEADAPVPTTGTAATSTTLPTVVARDVSAAYGVVPDALAAQLLVGCFEEAQDDWMTTTGVNWDVRYRYLVGGDAASGTSGWVDNWSNGAQPSDGAFLSEFLDETGAQGYIPAISYYCMHDLPSSTGRVGWEADWLDKLQTPTRMAAYFGHVRLLMELCASFGQPVIVMVEPDGLGFLQQQTGSDPYAYAAIAASGLSELGALPNTVAGWGQAWLAMRNATGATNVLLGTHVSGWASGLDIIHFDLNESLQTHTDIVHAFMAPCGILPNVTDSTYDFLVGDPLDRDADYYQLVRGENRWWDASPTAPINTRSFNRYAEWLRLWNVTAGLRWLMWQIPCGTDAQLNVPYNGTQGSGYRDNRSEYFFGASGQANRQKWIDAGVIALLFGQGQGEQTTPWTDNDYLMRNAVIGHSVPRESGGSGVVIPDTISGTASVSMPIATALGLGTGDVSVGAAAPTSPLATCAASGPGPEAGSFGNPTTPIATAAGSGHAIATGTGAPTTDAATSATAAAASNTGTGAATTTTPYTVFPVLEAARSVALPSANRAQTDYPQSGRNSAVSA